VEPEPKPEPEHVGAVDECLSSEVSQVTSSQGSEETFAVKYIQMIFIL
jgi:hypothetical protein